MRRNKLKDCLQNLMAFNLTRIILLKEQSYMHYLLQTKSLIMKNSLQNVFAEVTVVRQEKTCLFLPQKILFFCFLLLFSFASKAQNGTVITGKVTDSAGAPIQSVTVVANHSKKGVLTNQDGVFSLPVTSADKKITFSIVGMVPVVKTLNGETTFNISLMPDNTNLNEVVVVGLWYAKEGSITAAISTVTSKDIDRVHAGSTVSTTLAGKLPGVTFRQAEGRPGASASIQITEYGNAIICYRWYSAG